MSSYKIKQIHPKELVSGAVNWINNRACDISLKQDGTLLRWKDGKFLVSDRQVVRNSRYKHIVKLLQDNNITEEIVGEMFIDGGNIFDINSSKNWHKAQYYIFDINEDLTTFEKQKKIDEIVDKINNIFILKPIRFSTIKEGWDYVIKNNSEGLVIKTLNEWFKIKQLHEAKVKVIGLEKGTEKGAFNLAVGGKVSATSSDYVKRYEELTAQGKDVYLEIEFAFMTREGKYFQPRLRKIGVKEEII